MSTLDRAELRALVREVVRDAVKDLAVKNGGASKAPAPPAPAPAPAPPPVQTVADQFGVTPSGPLNADQKHRAESVRLTSDRELDAFVRTLLKLFENPKARADLKAGRLTFRLAGATTSGRGASQRIDSGAVTERHIADVAAAGASLVLGPRAVLTPLAREKARALGVTIEKEKRR
ncbi:hypothetical protein [Mycolicibacterium litorale]|uniref:Uncharacterized protein n=1 Tax=Mycolicibacterium litorale TaxID=758802 RepID=A0AAD1IN35_9MYCO|nr:hypothetical protein [Mycolicibacterium litorale]MCV7417163.1 hypothetical protein [Mycolicibacterium litorale]TDY04951.1 hypothetical protein BCL50_3732 [Mycolicibacterium litorale]BBY18380.1 hypothetical protein MLIT_39720 [Mycolicibacterium litorale]